MDWDFGDPPVHSGDLAPPTTPRIWRRRARWRLDARAGATGNGFTLLRATLICVADNQNITLSLPRPLLRQIKRLAVDRETSVSALMMEALARVADEDRRYSAARRRALAAMKSAGSLGTRGRRAWTRDELHAR